MFVKICGITRQADATAAVEANADAIGLNFVASSRRFVDLETGRMILAVVPDDVMTVGVFRNHGASEVLEITERLGLNAAQLHGQESPETTAAVAAGVSTVIKVITAGSAQAQRISEFTADIVMIDAPTPGGGKPFDWDLVGDLVETNRILLAGGLRPDTVAAAVRQVRPWGVDVASGVESGDSRTCRDESTKSDTKWWIVHRSIGVSSDVDDS